MPSWPFDYLKLVILKRISRHGKSSENWVDIILLRRNWNIVAFSPPSQVSKLLAFHLSILVEINRSYISAVTSDVTLWQATGCHLTNRAVSVFAISPSAPGRLKSWGRTCSALMKPVFHPELNKLCFMLVLMPSTISGTCQETREVKNSFLILRDVTKQQKVSHFNKCAWSIPVIGAVESDLFSSRQMC